MLIRRCATLRQPLASATGTSIVPLRYSWHYSRLSSRHSSGFQHPLQPASRVREVEAACSALVESVEAGDGPWFERLVVQLRDVLAEQRAEIIAQNNAPRLPAARSEPQQRLTYPVTEKPESSEADEMPLWRKTLQLLEAAAAEADAEVSFQEKPRFEAPKSTFREVPRPSAAQEAAPAWLRALQLLEQAAAETPEEPQQDTEAHRDEDAGVTEYLASFTESAASKTPPPPPVSPDEPAWLRALRLLEAAEIPDGTSSSSSISPKETTSAPASHEHAEEDQKMDRYSQLLGAMSGGGGSQPSQDPKQAIRMQRYTELLREADDIGKNTSPGGSVPSLRFRKGSVQKSRPPPAAPPSVPPFPVAETSSSSSSSGSKLNGGFPPPPPVQKPAAAKKNSRKAKASASDPLSQAVGRGNLTTSLPGPADDDIRDDAILRKEDFVWSEHEFNNGEKENKRVLRKFKAEFKKMAAETPDGLRNSKLLTAALDLALACVKCYELDKADAIYRRCIGECRRRGLPWDVKCIQDMATLRCKQHRQADAAELLEELANKAPPHPATFINLGTVYNQLRMYEKAEVWFQQAVNLKGGTPGREDLWNIGIAKKNMKFYDEALPMLEQALAEFQEHEPHHPVTIAKLHSSVAGCLHDMGQPARAIEEYQKAHELYLGTVGSSSPLFCSAAEGLAKSLRDERRYSESFTALLESFEVHAKGDAVHPTPLFEGLEMALDLHDKEPEVPLSSFPALIDAAVANLDSRGLAEDGNAGLVMSRGGKLMSRLGAGRSQRAHELLQRGVALVKRSHDAGEADLMHEVMEGNLLMQKLEQNPAGDLGTASTHEGQQSISAGSP